MSKHCSYWKYRNDPPCSENAAYLLELISRQGSRCQVTVCRDHVHKAWEFGERILEYRFPGRKLKLSMIRLMPILETSKKNKQAKAVGADG